MDRALRFRDDPHLKWAAMGNNLNGDSSPTHSMRAVCATTLCASDDLRHRHLSQALVRPTQLMHHIRLSLGEGGRVLPNNEFRAHAAESLEIRQNARSGGVAPRGARIRRRRNARFRFRRDACSGGVVSRGVAKKRGQSAWRRGDATHPAPQAHSRRGSPTMPSLR